SFCFVFFFSSRRRHTRFSRDWSSDVCSSDLVGRPEDGADRLLDDQRQAPGGEQRLERAAIEPADDAAFDGDADERGDEEGGGQRSEERRVGKECRGGGAPGEEKKSRGVRTRG